MKYTIRSEKYGDHKQATHWIFTKWPHLCNQHPDGETAQKPPSGRFRPCLYPPKRGLHPASPTMDSSSCVGTLFNQVVYIESSRVWLFSEHQLLKSVSMSWSMLDWEQENGQDEPACLFRSHSSEQVVLELGPRLDVWLSKSHLVGSWVRPRRVWVSHSWWLKVGDCRALQSKVVNSPVDNSIAHAC